MSSFLLSSGPLGSCLNFRCFFGWSFVLKSTNKLGICTFSKNNIIIIMYTQTFFSFFAGPWADCLRFHSQWKQRRGLRRMACELSQSCHLQSGILLLLLWRTSAVYGNYWHWSPEDIALLLGRHFSTLAESRCSRETWLTTHTAGWRTLWQSPITMESLGSRSMICALSWNCEGLKDYTKSRNLLRTLMDFAADWKHRL